MPMYNRGGLNNHWFDIDELLHLSTVIEFSSKFEPQTIRRQTSFDMELIIHRKSRTVTRLLTRFILSTTSLQRIF